MDPSLVGPSVSNAFVKRLETVEHLGSRTCKEDDASLLSVIQTCFLLFPQDLHSFFRGQTIVHIHIPKDDGGGGRMKGFALVEFESRDDLIQALAKNEETLKNRKLRVDLAESNNNPRDAGKWMYVCVYVCVRVFACVDIRMCLS